MVELGTYCAYSTIRMAHAILEYLANISSSSRGRSDFHIYTVDIHSQTVARQLVEMAGLSQHITFIQRPPVAAISELDDLSELLRSCITSSPKSSSAYDNNPKIDFLFIDHAKELYLSDLMQLERSQLLQADSAVVADNVVFFGIDEYRQHMAELQNHNECIVQTRLVSENIYLEYAVVRPNKTEKNPPTNHEPQQQSQAQDLHALGDGLGKLSWQSMPFWENYKERKYWGFVYARPLFLQNLFPIWHKMILICSSIKISRFGFFFV
jgi:catechol O-methyltransferase